MHNIIMILLLLFSLSIQSPSLIKSFGGQKKIKKEEESCLKDAKITAKRVEETDTTNFLLFTVSYRVPLLDVDDCPNISTLQPPRFNFFWRILSFVAANLFELIKRGNKSFPCLQFVSFYRGGTKGWKGLFFLEWEESSFLSRHSPL